MAAGETASDKEQSTPSTKSDTPTKDKSPGDKGTSKSGAASSPDKPSGAAAHESAMHSRRDGRRPPHKEDHEIIFDWRNNAVTTLLFALDRRPLEKNHGAASGHA